APVAAHSCAFLGFRQLEIGEPPGAGLVLLQFRVETNKAIVRLSPEGGGLLTVGIHRNVSALGADAERVLRAGASLDEIVFLERSREQNSALVHPDRAEHAAGSRRREIEARGIERQPENDPRDRAALIGIL